MSSEWWLIPTGIVGGLALLWAALVIALWFVKPDELGLRDALRLLPDVVRLVKRLASDPTMPRGVRIRLALLLAYLALPIDLVPDFIPVLGYADDAIIVPRSFVAWYATPGSKRCANIGRGQTRVTPRSSASQVLIAHQIRGVERRFRRNTNGGNATRTRCARKRKACSRQIVGAVTTLTDRQKAPVDWT